MLLRLLGELFPHPSWCVAVSVRGTRVRQTHKELFFKLEMAAGRKEHRRNMIDAGCLSPAEPPSAFPSFEPRNIDLCLLRFIAL